MSKTSRRGASLQPSSIFLLVLAGLAGLVIAGLVISRVQVTTADAGTITHDGTTLHFAALAESDRKALLDIEIDAASAATRLDGTSEDRAQATAQLSTLADSVAALGPGVTAGMRKHIAGQIEQAQNAAKRGDTEQAVRVLRELSNSMASGRSA
jgi:hypothetical protein